MGRMGNVWLAWVVDCQPVVRVELVWKCPETWLWKTLSASTCRWDFFKRLSIFHGHRCL